MRTCIKNLFLLPVMIAGLELIPAGRVMAQPTGNLWLYQTVNGFSDYCFEKIDPSSGAVLQTITHSSGTIINGNFAYGGGYLWLYQCVNGNSDYCFEKIDPSSGAILQTITHSSGTIINGSFTFEQQWAVTTSSSPSNGGGTSGGGTYDDWTTATVTATLNSGYTFANWTVGGSVVSTSASYPFTVSADTALVANFTQITYTIAVSASPSIGGTVGGGGTFASGTSQTVTATANSGYVFTNWTENGSVVSSSASYNFTLNGNRNLVANFNQIMYTIAVSASPSIGGTVGGGGTFASGTSRTVTATANSGYVFTNWTENGSAVSSSASYNFTLNGNRNLVANFVTPLLVTNLQFGPSGVNVFFDRAINASVLSLYGSNVPAAFTMVGSTSGPVTGSLIIGAQATSVNFIKTGGLLVADNYTVTLLSATNGFKDLLGNLLDGNGDGVPGDNYVSQFTVAPSTNRVVSLPGFARGPGQFVTIPVTNSGIPLTINEGTNALSVSLTVQYDTNLLKITGASLGNALPAGWRLTNNPSAPGNFQLSLGGSIPLSPGTNTIATLTAQVPWCASYGASGIVSIGSVQLNGGTIPATGGSAVEVAALLGDTDGDGSYTTNDAHLILYYYVKLINGFPAYSLIDPEIIGDVLGHGQVDLSDAVVINQEAVGTPAPGIIPNLPQPSLVVAMTKTQALISWPQCTSGYILEQSTSLGAQANWTAVTNMPVFIGDQQSIYAAQKGAAIFYRLRKP
jgi:hypothetical protein